LSTALPTVRPLGGLPSGNVSNASTVTKNAASAKNLADTPEEVVAEESAKKPRLGEVRLSAPKVTRTATGSENGTPDPGLPINGVSAADSSGISMLANKGKGPVAPLPIGGDVKVAKLIASVPPVYPQMARTQRVSGDVTIDALIDVNGRVTTTRVLAGPALLHDAATNAVKQWKYQPATLNGIPTATHLTVTVQFKLQ
jgi:TonB family protein